jgi:hypothetical protein
VFYQLQIADCWCGCLQIADFREQKGRNLAELAAAKGTQFSFFIFSLSLLLLLLLSNLCCLIGCQVGRLLICLKKKIAEVPLVFTPFSEQLLMVVKAYFLGFGSQVP